jgi:hypothetical protein
MEIQLFRSTEGKKQNRIKYFQTKVESKIV